MAQPSGMLALERIGPLATFDRADTWVEHPYKEGVVLVGDAAATTDPTYGQGYVSDRAGCAGATGFPAQS